MSRETALRGEAAPNHGKDSGGKIALLPDGTSAASNTPLAVSNKKAARRAAGLAALWALWLGLCLLGLLGARAVQARYPAVSLRYRQPLSAGAATDARLHAIARPEGAFWPTFWAEQPVTAESDLAAVTAQGTFFSGDATLVRPLTYRSGGGPGAVDDTGCAVSSGLAWALWGSLDALGNTLTLDGHEYTVRGVYDESGNTALIGMGERACATGWTAAELAGGPTENAAAAAETFARAAGLGTPDAVIDGPGVAAFAEGLAALAMLLPAAVALVLLVLRLTRGRVRREVLLYLALGALALALPTLLAALPASVIPAKWSDFSFWAALAAGLKTGLLAFVNAGTSLKDAEVKLLLAGQLCLFFATLAAGFGLLRRYRAR